MNVSVVRPLVDRFYEDRDVSIGEYEFLLFRVSGKTGGEIMIEACTVRTPRRYSQQEANLPFECYRSFPLS